MGEGVGGQQVQAPVADERRGGGRRVQDVLHTGGDPRRAARARDGAARPGGAGEVEQVSPFRLVQLQRPGDSAEDLVGDAGDVAFLQPRVVVDRDAGEHRDFLPAQPGHAPAPAIQRHPRLIGSDLGAAGGEELADLGTGVHARRLCRLAGRRGVLSDPPITAASLACAGTPLMDAVRSTR